MDVDDAESAKQTASEPSTVQEKVPSWFCLVNCVKNNYLNNKIL